MLVQVRVYIIYIALDVYSDNNYLNHLFAG